MVGGWNQGGVLVSLLLLGRVGAAAQLGGWVVSLFGCSQVVTDVALVWG